MPTGLRARDVARDATRRLQEAGVPEAAASAEVLLSELLGIRRGEIALHDLPLTEVEVRHYEGWISRRAEREPVQCILGRAHFRNLALLLDDRTLIPRPDTEAVVDAALECLDVRGEGHILDVGTGSGAIAISIAQERPRARVHATDISEEALRIARQNARQNGASVEFHRADLFPEPGLLAAPVDLLVSNPPYISSSDLDDLAPEVRDWDPRVALDGGPDGLHFYRRIFTEAPALLAEDADVVLEVGDGQAQDVLELGREACYRPCGVHADLAGTPRVAVLRWEG